MTWSDIPGDDPTNAAMIKRDGPAAAPSAPEAEDPLAAVRGALDELIEFVSEDTLEAGRPMAGGYGCMGPDTVGCQRRYDAVLDEVRKLVLSQVCGLVARAQAAQEPEQASIDTAAGLTVEHVPGDRWSVR